MGEGKGRWVAGGERWRAGGGQVKAGGGGCKAYLSAVSVLVFNLISRILPATHYTQSLSSCI